MTTLVRWDPAAEVDSLQSEMNRLFDGFFGAASGPKGVRRWVPPMDLVESEHELILTADLPGLSEENVSIEVRDGVLVISGERENSRRDTDLSFHRAERSFGRFARTLTLPRGVDASASPPTSSGVLRSTSPSRARKPHQ